MDKSFFRRSAQDTSSLLPQYSKPIPLADLPPRPYTDSLSPSHRSRASASPLSASRHPHVKLSGPPPPIVGSAFLNVPQVRSSRSMAPLVPTPQVNSTAPVATNPLLSLSRRERAIQSELQQLLDVQSARLVQGRTGDHYVDDRSSDAGSSTPTTRSVVPSPSQSRQNKNRSENRGVIPVRQPRKKKTGLKGARKGILSAMEELRAVKEHEEVIIDKEINTSKSLLSHVHLWEKKISSFEQEMRRINEGTGGGEIGELRAEKSAVETEIKELEERLFNLRARERHLSRRIEEVWNKTEAEMSSFREGRRGVEGEVNEFLRRPPVLEVSLAIITKHEIAGQGGGLREAEVFLSLPPKRRTLEMAKDWLSANFTILSRQREATEKERKALELGAKMWGDAISVITTFEEALQDQMGMGKKLEAQDLAQQLEEMQTVIRDLELKAQEAERKGWNLLICAIGAELEAFREGEGLLRDVMATLDPTRAVNSQRQDLPPLSAQTSDGVEVESREEYLKNSNGNQSSIDQYDDAREELVSLQRDNSRDIGSRAGQELEKGLGRRDSSPYRSGTESEDDGPPAALLVEDD